MNLIEQLGGYENSRGLLNLYEYSISFKYYKEFDGDFESAGHVDVFIPDLKDALLKYRRQHNIYEAGDWIIKASRLKDDTLYQIDEIAESKNYVKTKCGVFIDAPMFKHATDEEIKAGKRLEVNDGN